MKYQVVERSFNELVELNVKVKTNQIQVNQHELNQEEFVLALKKGNKLFKMLKGFHYNTETKQGFFNVGKKLYQFRLKQLANILTLAVEDHKSYYIEIN